MQIYCIFESGRRSRSLDDDEQDDEGRRDNEVESDAERGGDADNAVSKFEDFLITFSCFIQGESHGLLVIISAFQTGSREFNPQ